MCSESSRAARARPARRAALPPRAPLQAAASCTPPCAAPHTSPCPCAPPPGPQHVWAPMHVRDPAPQAVAARGRRVLRAVGGCGLHERRGAVLQHTAAGRRRQGGRLTGAARPPADAGVGWDVAARRGWRAAASGDFWAQRRSVPTPLVPARAWWVAGTVAWKAPPLMRVPTPRPPVHTQRPRTATCSVVSHPYSMGPQARMVLLCASIIKCCPFVRPRPMTQRRRPLRLKLAPCNLAAQLESQTRQTPETGGADRNRSN